MVSNYWDKKALDYDNHTKKSEKAYLKVIELIKEEINDKDFLLDIGTGTGEIPTAISHKAGNIIATDFSQEMINIASSKAKKLNIDNISFQVKNCYNLGYHKEKFDVIIASNLLHLLDNPEQFIKSLKDF